MNCRVAWRIGVSLALWAMALNVFWPFLASANPERNRLFGLVEIAQAYEGDYCVTRNDAPNQGHGAPHCPFCTLAGDKAPLLSPPGAWNLGVLPAELPAAEFRAPAFRAASQYLPSLPRAPPRFS